MKKNGGKNDIFMIVVLVLVVLFKGLLVFDVFFFESLDIDYCVVIFRFYVFIDWYGVCFFCVFV